MAGRRQYSVENSRLPTFTQNFRAMVDEIGGVSAMSEKTGISRPTINFWYNGQRTPDAENLIVLADKLGVSADYLLGVSKATPEKADSSKTLMMERFRSLIDDNMDYLLGFSDVQSTDATIQSVCRFTGLSEKAVMSLAKMKHSGDFRSLRMIGKVIALYDEDEQGAD